MFKKVFALCVCVLSSALLMKPALAANVSVSVKTTITGAQLLADCSGGTSSQRWQVSMNVRVSNGSETTVTFQDTEYWAKFTSTSGGSNQIQNDITVVDSGGFVAGTQLARGESRDFTPVVQVSLPCDTKAGDMFAALHLVGNDKQYSDGNTFIGGSTPVPVGATGGVGIAVLVTVGALVSRRRHRRLVTSKSAR